MKKFVAITLALLALAMALSALADVIWMPNDSFFKAHYDECTRIDKRYEAIRDSAVYDRPGGKATGAVAEGDTLYLSYAWQDSWASLDWKDGWVKLEDFRRLYDEGDFLSDHVGEIMAVSGALVYDETEPFIRWDDLSEELNKELSDETV